MTNTNDFDITIKDVVEFFYTIGFTWEHRYYNHKSRRFEDAKTFNDIVSSYPHTTTLELYSGENMGYVDFFITPTKFTRYREETNVMGSGSNIYVDRDYSKNWVKFIVEKKYRENIEDAEDINVQAK